MKKALALAFALTLPLAGVAVAQDKAAAPKSAEAKGTVRHVELKEQAIVLEDGTRLSVSDKQIDQIWAGDQVKAGYELRGDKNFVTDLEVDRFSGQEAD